MCKKMKLKHPKTHKLKLSLFYKFTWPLYLTDDDLHQQHEVWLFSWLFWVEFWQIVWCSQKSPSSIPKYEILHLIDKHIL
jgi:hypothetical protein